MERITIRLQTEEYQALREKAFRARLPLAVYAREVLKGVTPRMVYEPQAESTELLSVLQKMLSNLTQLSHQISPIIYKNLYSKFQNHGLKIKLGESIEIDMVAQKIKPLSEKLNQFSFKSNTKQNINHMEFLDLLRSLDEFTFK
jgi:hypothetical protein